MIFGGYNENQFVGDIQWIKLKNSNWWALDMRELNYGSQNIASFAWSDNSLAIIDTGTSLATMPKKYFTKFINFI